jgi:hypothetical protein
MDNAELSAVIPDAPKGAIRNPGWIPGSALWAAPE